MQSITDKCPNGLFLLIQSCGDLFEHTWRSLLGVTWFTNGLSFRLFGSGASMESKTHTKVESTLNAEKMKKYCILLQLLYLIKKE